MSGPPQISLVCCGLVGTTIGDGFGQVSMVERAFGEAIATQGVVAGTRDYARCMAQVNRDRGRSTVDVFYNLFPNNQARAQAASLAFERSYRAFIDRHGLSTLPGADQAIDKLVGSGIQVCLVTSVSRNMLSLILDAVGWRGRFDLTLCPDDVPRGFPWPDLVITALLRLGASDVREVAVASGTDNGLLGARRAGAQIAAGILTGPHTPARLRKAGATHLIESIADLPDLVA
ncbi:MAG TPA: HAD family hydrolase [Streptosporangiaceae bacterium]|nr:HAD family hydrolase [Streptosporangiaceae bacterium]